MGDIDAAGGEVTEEENTEDVLTESETVDVNAGDDFSDNNDNSGRLEAGEDVNCNDEVLAGFDEKLSMDLIVIVTTVGLPLDDGIGVTDCETALFTAVGVRNLDENVTCDVAPIAGNDDVSWTDKNDDINVTVESDCTCSVEDESKVTDVLVIIDTDSCCEDIAGDSSRSCEELVPVIICDDGLETEDVAAVVITDEVDNPWVTRLELTTKEVENTLLVSKDGVEVTATDDEVMFTVQFLPVKFGGQVQV